MSILILEDERRAAERLKKLVEKLRPQARIEEAIDSVEDAVHWLNTHSHPDIILMDIELADGKSFKVLNECNPNSKIIFCTAFDQYALEAFRHQGIAYLMKPIKEEELEAALAKAEKDPVKQIDYDKLAEAIEKRSHKYHKRILVRLGQRYKAIPTDHIAYIFTEEKHILAMTTEGKDIPLDQTMEQLEHILDPQQFFRINRKFIVNVKSIDNMYAWSRSRLKLELNPSTDMDVIVATERASNFKAWLEGMRE